MMLTTSLPLLPPASSSLLPSLNPTPNNDPSSISIQHSHHHPHPARRTKPTPNARSTLALLSADERSIAQRKMAIAMYGYSWLKPAGCSKTMLGRREEEVEREEVERQLREVEMQERVAVEAEEQERIARLNEAGEVQVEGERDLDDDVPEAADEEGDLDDEIPEAEGESEEEDDEDDMQDEGSESIQEGWVYDSRREPDTDEEYEGLGPQPPGPFPSRRARDAYEEREAETLANAMLDEDEMGEFDAQQRDEDMMTGGGGGSGGRDLDDDVPEADEGWEHTDTEFEESEMDISILPAAAQPSSSGFVPPRPPLSTGRRGGARVVSGNAAAALQTPATAESLSLGMSSSDVGTSNQQNSSVRRSWLNAAGARRNLFGISGRGGQTTTGVSGRLFTPSPVTTPATEEEPRRRSGRLLEGLGRRGENREQTRGRDSLD